MNKNIIALKKLDAIVIGDAGSSDNFSIALSLNAEFMNLGFIMSEQLLNTVRTLDEDSLSVLAETCLSALRELKGAHVTYKPMYPGFPTQIMQASYEELYYNALVHYWSMGTWLPNYAELPKSYEFEATKFREIDIASEVDFKCVFTKLLMSNDSVSEEDKQILEWFMLNVDHNDLEFPEDIPFAENKCVISAIMLAKSMDITPLVRTSTDILRIVTYLSEGDVSLTENTKFISLPRSLRKTLVEQLERVINEEDIGRHRNKWVRLFHSLHVGDYSEKVYGIAKKARNNEALASFYGRLEYLLNTKNTLATVALLKTRPGEFGRKLDQLLRMEADKKPGRLQRLMSKPLDTNQQVEVVESFLSVVDDIPSRNLLQLLGHLKRRNVETDKRIVFPKGSTQKAVIVKKELPALDEDLLASLVKGIKDSLIKRFAEKNTLGKVWIDPDLMGCPVPSQNRSASSGLFSVARGSRLPVGDDNTLRFFVYWVGRDIDLSASFHNSDFSLLEHVSYTNLKSDGYQSFHSGDITSAPTGACEFIDIAIDSAVKRGARYLAMNVMVYSGPTFAEHDTCFAGWMTRSAPNSNEVFQAKSVQQKIDIKANSKNVIPVIFDLVEKKAIWTDISTRQNVQWGGNNIESNRASIEQKISAIVGSNHKVSLYELFEMHAIARGELVAEKEEANLVFSINSGVTPYHIDDINAKFIG